VERTKPTQSVPAGQIGHWAPSVLLLSEVIGPEIGLWFVDGDYVGYVLLFVVGPSSAPPSPGVTEFGELPVDCIQNWIISCSF